ncbi:MAG: dicarboxylate/amino acid:cation symporter [Caulobacterales bacterium]
MSEAAAALIPGAKKSIYRLLYFWVLAGVVAGALLGHFAPDVGAAMKPLGDGFIALVKMIIAPVIFCTVVTGIAGVQKLEGVGRIGVKALVYFLIVSTFALIVGLIVGNVVQPGAGMNIDPATLDAEAVQNYAQQAHERTITGFLLEIIPTTAISALTSGQILQVLLVSVLFGFGLAMMGERGKPLYDVISWASGAIFNVVKIIMYAAPVGAFGAMAFTIGKYGIGSLVDLAQLIGTFYLTAAIFVVVVLGCIAAGVGFSIFRLIAYLKEELLLVLGTSSSESALPQLIDKMERAGAPRTIVGLVVPAGYSFNLDGTNIYMTMAALFIAQACNIHLSLEQQILLLLVAMISSKGAAGVTGSGFITLAATLSVVPTVPIAGMALILGIDRFMSECRSLTNFIGNAVATLAVARWEGRLDKTSLHAALHNKGGEHHVEEKKIGAA